MSDPLDNTEFENAAAEPTDPSPAAEDQHAPQAEDGRSRGAALDRLAWVRHEIRTPLGAIASIAELLQSTSLDAAQHRLLETLKLSTQSLATNIDDMLQHESSDTSDYSYQPEPFDLRDFLANTAVTLTARAHAKGLTATIDIAETCPSQIVGDAIRIGQVLNNLIGNALKFTETGSIYLTVTPDEDGDGADVLNFEIFDTGQGLPAVERETIFEPYVSASGNTEGSGLGLAIARQLVHQMGGEIGCEEQYPQGSLFWFTVPMDADVAVSQPRPKHLSACPSTLSGHVLIVEDNAINQVLIATMVKQFGLTFDMAVNGSEALQAVSANNYDLILMDTLMPDIDGREVTRQIRAMAGANAHLPIIALTAKTMEGDREEHLDAGANGFVPKPIEVDTLYVAVAEILHQGRPQTAESLAS